MKTTIITQIPKHYSVRQLAALYEVSIVTFRKWLKPLERKIGLRVGHYYIPNQVARIFEVYGVPPGLRGKKLRVKS